MNLGFHRTEAIGDILMLSGVFKHLKQEGHRILLSTKYNNISWPELMDVDFYSNDKELIKLMSDKHYDLDMCYEKRPTVPIWQAYSEEVVGKSQIFFPKLKAFKQPKILIEFPSGKTKRIIIHPSVSSLSRTLPKQVWQDVVDYINIKTQYEPIVVGTSVDYLLENAQDVRGFNTIQQTRQLINGASLFIGMDSGPMHLAQATNTPIIGIFTIARPENRIWRPKRTHSIEPLSNCRFCLEKTSGVNMIPCNGEKCISTITSDRIISKIQEVL